MKILLVTSMVPQAEGAGAIPLLLHAQLIGLAKRHEVTLVTAVGDEPGEAEAAAELAAANFDVHFADRRQSRAFSGRWRRRWRFAWTWASHRVPWRAVWFADPGIQTILDRMAKTRDFDVIAVEDSAISMFRLPPGVPTLLTEHEVLHPRPIDWRPGWPSQWLSRAWHEVDWRRRPRFQRRAWRRFDRVLVFTRRDAASVAKLAPEIGPRLRVSPFGMSLPSHADAGREEAETLLFIGNFTHQPNRDAADWLGREIMPLILARHPAARLRIVGTAPPPEILSLASASIDVIADAPAVQPHIDAATIVLAPVRTGGGMRMKVLQALAAGKATITTSRGAEGLDVFDPDPPLEVADSGEEIAESVSLLLRDPARRHDLARRARLLAERHYSPDAWARRLEEIYQDTVEVVAAP